MMKSGHTHDDGKVWHGHSGDDEPHVHLEPDGFGGYVFPLRLSAARSAVSLDAEGAPRGDRGHPAARLAREALMELRRLAEAATRGPWWHARSINYRSVATLHRVGDGYAPPRLIPGEGAQGEANAAYIAAADPDTVLRLLDDRDAAVSARQEAESRMARWAELIVSYADLTHRVVKEGGDWHEITAEWSLVVAEARATLARTREPAGEVT